MPFTLSCVMVCSIKKNSLCMKMAIATCDYIVMIRFVLINIVPRPISCFGDLVNI